MLQLKITCTLYLTFPTRGPSHTHMQICIHVYRAKFINYFLDVETSTVKVATENSHEYFFPLFYSAILLFYSAGKTFKFQPDIQVISGGKNNKINIIF